MRLGLARESPQRRATTAPGRTGTRQEQAVGLTTQDELQARNRYSPVEVLPARPDDRTRRWSSVGARWLELPVSGTTLDRRRKGDLGSFV